MNAADWLRSHVRQLVLHAALPLERSTRRQWIAWAGICEPLLRSEEYCHTVVVKTAAALTLVSVLLAASMRFDESHSHYPILMGPMLIMIFLVLPLPPQAARGLANVLTPGPQLIVSCVCAMHHLIHAVPSPPLTEFTMAPVAFGLAVFCATIVAALRGFPFSSTITALGVVLTTHTIKPILGIGWYEPILVIVSSGIGILCGLAVSLEQRSLRHMIDLAESNRRADSRLNHVIKGQCGAASALLSELASMRFEGLSDTVAAETYDIISQIQGMLDEASGWCHKRESFIQLELGTYRTESATIELKAALQTMVGPRAVVESPESMVVDPTLLRLLVQEVVSNALKYSEDGSPINVKAEILPGEASEMLHLVITNSNRKGAAHLTPEECELAFAKGFKKGRSTGDHVTRHSNGLGLSSVKMATEAVGGKAWICADAKSTCVHLLLPAAPPAEAPEFMGNKTTVAPVRSSVRVIREHSINGAAFGALPPLLDRLQSSFDATGRTLSSPGASVPSSTSPSPHFVSERTLTNETLPPPAISLLTDRQLSSAPCTPLGISGVCHSPPLPPLRQLPSALCSPLGGMGTRMPSSESVHRPVCIGIDDSPGLRRMQGTLFRVFLKADEQRSGSVGKTVEEVNAYVDIVMGRRSISLEPTDLPQADIAVLDQNIEMEEEALSVKGTDVVLQLRESGFTGVTCILSASSGEETERLACAPGVDLAFGKDADLNRMTRALLDAYEKKCPAKTVAPQLPLQVRRRSLQLED